MGQFFKFTFASCLGTILALGILSLIGIATISSVASSANAPKNVKANSVLEMKFSKPIPEKTNNIAIDPLSFETEETLGLHDIIATIENAKEDNDIEGIFLDLSALGTGQATASILRDAIVDFKSDGKFVVAYSKFYTQGAYYIASAADKVYVNPMGGVDFRGFAAQIPFFKDMLDRLGIKMQIYYAGQFKSATEPYRLQKMSEQNRLQTREYVEGMYQLFLEDIAESRSMEVSELRRIADEYLLRNADDAVQHGFVDGVAYRDQIYDDLRERLALEDDDKINGIAFEDYSKGRLKKTNFSAKNKIAVIFAEGTIVDGEGDAGSIGGDKYAKIIRKIRKDEKVKAVVLRVNSGGGSGLASDIMWRELELVKEAGIPYVVSMGDLAASGGYYIACNADTIYAEPNTITGSIGVFGMIPSLEDMLKEKVGVTFDTVATGQFATGISPFKNISPEEGKIIQASVEEFYDIFLKRVSDGRGMSRNEAHEIAQGRVWTGMKAKELGLVDAFGGLQEAIETAANMANLAEYRTSEYPRIKDPMTQLIEKFSGKETAQAMLKSELGDMYPFYNHFKELKEMEGVQARLPFFVEFN